MRQSTPIPANVWQTQFERLTERLDKMGYEVELETRGQDRAELAEGTIIINSTKHAESRFYTLLHELGHILIRTGWDDYAKTYPYFNVDPLADFDRRQERSRTYQVALIAEEIEAWRVGLEYARKCRYYVDRDKYNKESSTAIHSYIKWVYSVRERANLAGQKAAKSRQEGMTRRRRRSRRTSVQSGRS